MANTVPLANNKTKSMNSNFDYNNRLMLSENIVFDGKNGQYEIFADRRIGMGGESQVFIAERLSDKKEVIAKIYDEYQDTYRNRANRQKAIDFVSNHANYPETHILPILDYGIISITVEGQDQAYIKPIDILPFCIDGEIEMADYKTLRAKIIPQVLHAINLMHKYGIVHRDIKPGNIYIYHDQVVVADFGTACEISSSSTENFIGTKQKRGTVGYTAPEVWQGYAVVESDYFSLGCTIATLKKGEHVYQRLIDLDDEGAINKAINSNGLPLDCPEDEADLQILVNALTVMNEAKRAGYDDVQLWLQDPEAFERKFKFEKHNGDDDFLFYFKDTICRNGQELINAFVSDWDTARDYLYRGGIKNSTIVNFFSKINQSLAIRIGDIIEDRETATNYDLGLAKTLHFIADGGPLYWKGKIYRKLTDIAAAISSGQATEDEIVEMIKSHYISWKLENTSKGEEIIEMVKTIESMAEKYPKLAYHLCKYQFAGKPSEHTYKGTKTSDEVFALITKKPYEFYKNAEGLINDDDMLAYLSHLGYVKHVIYFKEKLSGKMPEDIELFYRLFEGICSNRAALREQYYKFGPQSHLYWLQQNLNMYEFNSSQAHKIRENILKIKFSSASTIDELFRSFGEMKEYQKDFLSIFQGNILLALWGITGGKEKTGITSSNSDAYYLKEFWGHTVPIGYLRHLQSKG